MSVIPATEAAGRRAADLAVTCLVNCFLREAGPATELDHVVASRLAAP